jgi:hypothetical protein
MKRLVRIGTAMVAFSASVLFSADLHAAGGYWNNSGFAISHQFYPGLSRSYSFYNYAPQYYGFNRYYKFDSQRPRRSGDDGEREAPVPIASETWAKKCTSSCADLSVDP